MTPSSCNFEVSKMKKYIAITGASSGIGQALTICFSNSGYNVLAIGRNEIALQRTKTLANTSKVTVVVADLSEDAELDKVVTLLKEEDRIKYLIHCAAITEPHLPLTMVTRLALEKVINVNVMAPIFLTQKLSPYFDAVTTRVLFIGSDYVGVNNKIRPNLTGSYGISKSALRVAVEYFRHEYKNTALIGYLNPGSTNTPMFDAMKTAVLRQQGIFNNSGQPVHPSYVAAFIQAVLERTSNQDYSTIDWDFRSEAHQKQVLSNETTIPTFNIRSKL